MSKPGERRTRRNSRKKKKKEEEEEEEEKKKMKTEKKKKNMDYCLPQPKAVSRLCRFPQQANTHRYSKVPEMPAYGVFSPTFSSSLYMCVKVGGKVPGSQYTALLDHGLIENPLYRDNDVMLRSLGRQNWTYSLNFSVPAFMVSSTNLTLVCEGLDTVAHVVLNGETLGRTDNMFIRFAFDVTGKLKELNNNLRVQFTSAVLEAESRANKSSYRIPPNCPPAVQHGECHVNQIRKEQCSFSWDWGPSFPTQGIWGQIYIDAFDSAIMRDVAAVVTKVNKEWQVEVQVYFDVIWRSLDWRRGVEGQLVASIMGLNVTFSEMISLTPIRRIKTVVLTVPKTSHVPMWWPRGYGQQTLFTLNVTFVSNLRFWSVSEITTISERTTKLLKLGFRTIELIQEPVKNKFRPHGGWHYFYDQRSIETGLSFYFKVNGIPIFLKGSNWIPADNFQERVTRERLQYLLSSAANVSINSLRVWGGGIYESDDFYEICDELGILVWQDMMFSVALYPAYPSFLKSVAAEISYQVSIQQ
ncbi:beta-mannosidase [Elysia marginata]|uniref:beta-mannosidase n=1 Tax=Elysia marginata TaxID=1093978 RepID=A0AAV4GN14_9GAST|nr:beta-mannosidase [Elysia marginata]